ncbi:MAG: glutathione S-transferase C-terminal domain-containing protein [Pseudomonadales bacterium]
MEYQSVEAAKDLPGLRLVLTAGVPGPWSESAKALFRHHQVEFIPVLQQGGQANPELVAWTKHRNAPVAMYNDEAPRVRWLELIDLAERLGKGPSLVPAERELRMQMVGLINEIAGENGFAWNARTMMLDTTYQAMGDNAFKNPMLKDYLYDPQVVSKAKEELQSFLTFLADHLAQQPGHYLIGDRFTAADLYWAYFSNLLQPQPHEINPMPGFLRKSYDSTVKFIESFDQRLIEQRDWIFEQHLPTPLEF